MSATLQRDAAEVRTTTPPEVRTTTPRLVLFNPLARNTRLRHPFALAILVRAGLAARKMTLPFGPFFAFGALVVLIVPALVATAGS